MAAQQLNLEKKEVRISQILEDLRSGLTKWKKDDIVFGSLEKKYNLLPQEAIELFSHPKIKTVESKIPTFVIVDDVTDEVTETKVELGAQSINETKVTATLAIENKQQITVVKEEPRERVVAFI
jgi:hypothetical protein